MKAFEYAEPSKALLNADENMRQALHDSFETMRRKGNAKNFKCPIEAFLRSLERDGWVCVPMDFALDAAPRLISFESAENNEKR